MKQINYTGGTALPGDLAVRDGQPCPRQLRRRATELADLDTQLDEIEPSQRCRRMTTSTAKSRHRLGPRDMSFVAKLCGHRAVAIPIVAVGGVVTVALSQQRLQP